MMRVQCVRPAGRAVAALSVVLALATAGCSSSASGPGQLGGSSPAGSVTSSASAGVSSAPGGGSSASGGGTSAPVGVASSSTDSGGKGGGGKGGDFCRQAASAQASQAKAAQGISGGSPADLRTLEGNALRLIKGLVVIAPPAIAGDMGTLLTSVQGLYGALAAVNFDVRKLDPAVFTRYDTAQFKRASSEIATYLRTHCGITTP